LKKGWGGCPTRSLGVVDALGADQEADVVLELGITRESVGDAGAGKVLEDLGTVALQPVLRPSQKG
jgi:hypothetical protein